jgi:hypothetical protein
MKKITLLITLFVVTLFSCNKDDNNSGSSTSSCTHLDTWTLNDSDVFSPNDSLDNYYLNSNTHYFKMEDNANHSLSIFVSQVPQTVGQEIVYTSPDVKDVKVEYQNNTYELNAPLHSGRLKIKRNADHFLISLSQTSLFKSADSISAKICDLKVMDIAP